MSDETWEKVKERIQLDKSLPEGTNLDQFRPQLELLAIKITELAKALVDIIAKALPPILELLCEALKAAGFFDDYCRECRKRWPVIKFVDAPRARRNIDRRPQRRNARSTI